MEHLLLTAVEHNYLQTHRGTLEANHRIKINLPEVDENALICSSDVIFASIHGDGKDIDAVKDLMKKWTAKNKCIAVVTLSDSDTPSEPDPERRKKRRKTKPSVATAATNGTGIPTSIPSSAGIADSAVQMIGEEKRSLSPAESFIPLGSGNRNTRLSKKDLIRQRLLSQDPLYQPLLSRGTATQPLKSRGREPQRIKSRRTVPQEHQSRGTGPQELQSRVSVPQELQSRVPQPLQQVPVCQPLQSREAVFQQLLPMDLLFQRRFFSDPVCQQLLSGARIFPQLQQSRDPVPPQLHQSLDDSVILLDDEPEAQASSVSVNETSANDSVILLEETTAASGAVMPAAVSPTVVPRPLPQRILRPVIIDGSNVARDHGRVDNTYSCLGIQIAVDYFLQRGHDQVTAFVPNFRRFKVHGHIPTTRPELLEKLSKSQRVVFTPSRNLNGVKLSCYDDRFIVELASSTNGVILSNDNYRDLVGESDAFRKTIEERLLMFCFVGDRIMIPNDPMGRNGPSLDTYLSLPSSPS